MIYKAMFDTKTPTWQAFGRAVFFATEEDDPLEHRRLAIIEAQKEYPGSEILIVGIGASTQAAWDGFKELKQRYADWLARSAAGIPNKREDLERRKPMSQSIASDRISESSIMRAAGNIAAGIVSRSDFNRSSLLGSEPVAAVASVCVAMARALAEEVRRTAPKETSGGGE